MIYNIIQGDNRAVLKTFPDNHFDSIVTDPPYGIDFLGKAWDANTGALETYQECLRVLKPGGHILAFSAARTYHHLAVTIEQAGFEIRDQIMWIYSSGFPKSQDVGKSIQRSLGVKEKKILDKTTGYTNKEGVKGKEKWMSPGNTTGDDYAKQQEQVVCTDPEAKQWSGWGTQLKPAHEPIVLARKPIKLSIAKNCQTWGTGALNINATRVGDEIFDTSQNRRTTQDEQIYDGGWADKPGGEIVQGRFPSNVLGDIPDYQKYFYCPKVSRKERHVGFDDPGPLFPGADGGGREMLAQRDAMVIQNKSLTTNSVPIEQNNHPTVKPIELMKYLIQLVTPPGGRVLDPFNGSGSTGCAAVELDYDYTGIELDPAYVDIATKRIAAWYQSTHSTNYTELFTHA
jgi:site-specific DNA-methyltransferase (adenine-specific)